MRMMCNTIGEFCGDLESTVNGLPWHFAQCEIIALWAFCPESLAVASVVTPLSVQIVFLHNTAIQSQVGICSSQKMSKQ
jgi:hypothetical protein